MEKTQLLFALLCSEVSETEISEEIKTCITKDKLEMLYRISSKHDISHIICSALDNNGLLHPEDEISNKFRKQQLLALYRYQRTNFEFAAICRTLREVEIPYLPLKGSVIRDLYPEPWLRTSCDIDILVPDEKLDLAVRAIVERLGYETDGARDFHDVSLHSPGCTHLELHFNILENLENIDKMLSDVWKYALPADGSPFEYRMTNEYLIFHILAHMSYHFINGGCGIRPFIDLLLVRKKLDYDEAVLLGICRECGIEKFYDSVLRLQRVWFEGAEHDDLTLQMENFILRGGVYGDVKAGIAARQSKKGGKFTYAIGRIFQPYDVIKQKYPIIRKHRWLTPFYEVKRWFDLLLRGKLKSSIKELEANNSVTKDQAALAADFLSKLGL